MDETEPSLRRKSMAGSVQFLIDALFTMVLFASEYY